MNVLQWPIFMHLWNAVDQVIKAKTLTSNMMVLMFLLVQAIIYTMMNEKESARECWTVFIKAIEEGLPG